MNDEMHGYEHEVTEPRLSQLLDRIAQLEEEAEALRESERKYRGLYRLMRLIADDVPDLIWAKDMEDRFIYVNQAMCDKLLMCAEPGEAIGKNHLYFVELERERGHEQGFGEICLNSDALAKETGAPVRLLEDGLVRDKRLVLDIHKAPLFSEDGELIGTVGCGRDVTKEQEIERSLRHSEARYRAIVEDQTELISRFSPDGVLRFVNDAYCRYYGESREELTGRDFWHHMPEQDQRELRAFLDSFDEHTRVKTIEHKVVDSCGKVKWLQWTDRAFFDETGRVIEYQAVGRDISARKFTEQALRESEERYRQLFELESDAILLCDDATGYILEVNAAAEALYGYKRHELLLMKKSQLRARPDELGSMARKRGAHDPLQFHKKKEGVVFPVEITVSHFVWRGHEVSIAAVRDVTERMLAEEEKEKLESQLRQAQKMEAIGTLAGGIAHDFNNILAPIIGYTEMALSELSGSSPAQRDLEQVLKAAGRARDLVRQILAFSRYGREEQKIRLDISSIVSEALKLLRASLPATIEIRQRIEHGMALADATQIHQVLMNLCTNAAHAMDHRGTLDVALESVELRESDVNALADIDLKPGAYLRLTVTDSGHGMDAATLQRIFDPYFTTKEIGEGSGLGLSVVHGIARRHKGAITVRSEPGKGSSFAFYLPKIEAEGDRIGHATADLPRGTERILVVDDEPMIAELEKSMLEQLGYRVQAQTDAIEALGVFRADPEAFDLVITDYTMPNLTGTELATAILDIRSATPIILSTGLSERIPEASANHFGISAFAAKPLDRRELAELVRTVLDARLDRTGSGSSTGRSHRPALRKPMHASDR